MASQESLVQQGRAAIDSVAARVKSDPSYAERFKEEPVAVLLEAGAPAEGMVDILRETGFADEDVSGYLLATGINLGPTLSTSSTRLTSPSSSIGRLPGGTGGLAECSGTCNCSSSCLFTF
jgi:hypothetical protein